MRRRVPVLSLVQTGPLIRLLLDGEVQGVVDEQGLAELLPAASTLAGIALRARPGATRALVVGVGLGSDVRRLRAQGVHTRAVEIDPRVAQLARHFGAGEVEVSDGRAAWKAALGRGERFDLVLLDACTGPGLLPRHLWTGRAVAELAALVAPRGGAVVARVIASPKERQKEAVERAFRRSFASAAWQADGLSPGGKERIVTFSSPAPERRAFARPALATLVAAGLAVAGCSGSPSAAKPPVDAQNPSASPASSSGAPEELASTSDAGSCPTLPPRLEPPDVPPAPDGRPGVRVVGFLLQRGNDLVLERISNETATARYTLRGAAAEPLRKLARGFRDRAEREQVRAWQRALSRAVGCHWEMYETPFPKQLSPVLVSVEGWSRPRTKFPPVAAAAGFDGELEVTRVRLTRTAAELGPPRAYLGWKCITPDQEGPLPAEPIAAELRIEQLEPARQLGVFGYLSRGKDGRYFLDAPHHEMGGIRFVLSGSALARIPTGAYFTQGDVGDDATSEQMATTLADLVGGGGVKRSNLRFSTTAVLVHGKARHVVSVDPDNMVRGEGRGYQLCPSHPDLPEGGELYEIEVEAIDWSLTRSQHDAFAAREVRPRIKAARAALQRKKPAAALAAIEAVAKAYARLLPIELPAAIGTGLLQSSLWIHKNLKKPADRAEDAQLLPLAVLLEGATSIESTRTADARALKEVIEEYVVAELERITRDPKVNAKIRARAVAGAAAMGEYRDESKPLMRRLKKIGQGAKAEPLRELLKDR